MSDSRGVGVLHILPGWSAGCQTLLLVLGLLAPRLGPTNGPACAKPKELEVLLTHLEVTTVHLRAGTGKKAVTSLRPRTTPHPF